VIRVTRAELLKLRTTPGPWVVMGVAVVLTGLGVLVAFLNTNGQGSAIRTPVTTQELRNLVGASYFYAMPLMAPLLGVLCITAEYRHKVITTTLLNTPRRHLVLIGKGAASVLWAVALCVATLLMVGALGFSWLSAAGGSVSDALHQVGPVVPGLFVDFALLAIFGLGVGVLVKNQIAGVLLTLATFFILEPVIYLVFLHALHDDLDWLPSLAAASVAGGLTGARSGNQPAELVWWTGALALLAWGIGPAVIGYFVTFNRDVT
jgi:ABC-type transport system involved in multi-copper enzyme maturation permease subunit